MSVMGKSAGSIAMRAFETVVKGIVVTYVFPTLVPRTIGILSWECLMVDGHAHIICTVVETWPARKMFLHGRHRARATSEISVATDRSRVIGSTRREIMVKLAVTRITMSMSGARVEGRGAGGRTAVVGDDAIVVTGIGLPVGDGVETLVEFLGTGEFPFAENSPENGGTSNGSGNGDDDGKCVSLCNCSARNGGSSSSVLGGVDRLSASDGRNYCARGGRRCVGEIEGFRRLSLGGRRRHG